MAPRRVGYTGYLRCVGKKARLATQQNERIDPKFMKNLDLDDLPIVKPTIKANKDK